MQALTVFSADLPMNNEICRTVDDHSLTPPAPIEVLVVDDDQKLCRLLKEYLEPMGYHVSVLHKATHVIHLVQSRVLHVVILDVMLPGKDGFEILRELRRISNIPVLMLSARGEVTDRIVGLEMGADDYLPKTFSNRELLARLRAVVRRHSSTSIERVDTPAASDIISGDLSINPKLRTARIGPDRVDLTPLEFDLLLYFVKNSSKVLTRDQLLDAVTGRNFNVFDRSVDVHISSLRRKLGDNARNPSRIRTIRAVGYMYVCTVDTKI